jgi:hypothetical protein
VKDLILHFSWKAFLALPPTDMLASIILAAVVVIPCFLVLVWLQGRIEEWEFDRYITRAKKLLEFDWYRKHDTKPLDRKIRK